MVKGRDAITQTVPTGDVVERGCTEPQLEVRWHLASCRSNWQLHSAYYLRCEGVSLAVDSPLEAGGPIPRVGLRDESTPRHVFGALRLRLRTSKPAHRRVVSLVSFSAEMLRSTFVD